MRGYGQYCPIALAAEVFAERWTPLIIRNLHLGCDRFTSILDGAPGLPRSVLTGRLRGLERAGVVRHGPDGTWTLTAGGRELAEVCLALGAWGARWRSARPEDQDPYLALWMVARLIDRSALPRPRIVVGFRITDRRPPNRYWLVVAGSGNEVCVHDPGYGEDGRVETDTAHLVRWYAGEIGLGTAMRDGGMTVTAPPWLERQLAAWGRLNPYTVPAG
ncbi:MAG TPA: helix-turn-helix domain-containing protein [Actinoplanes sp.]|nr:helix-turn-helix domain-containing protein [Actinoplanes sp.]